MRSTVEMISNLLQDSGSLQEQANLVSGFAVVFELDQSKTKFRAFRTPFDTPEEHRAHLPTMGILVQKKGWQADAVRVQPIGSLTRMAYTGQDANLSDSHIKRLDTVTPAYDRKDLRLLAGFPTAPLIHHLLINHPYQAVYTMKHDLADYGATLKGEGAQPS